MLHSKDNKKADSIAAMSSSSHGGAAASNNNNINPIAGANINTSAAVAENLGIVSSSKSELKGKTSGGKSGFAAENDPSFDVVTNSM